MCTRISSASEIRREEIEAVCLPSTRTLSEPIPSNRPSLSNYTSESTTSERITKCEVKDIENDDKIYYVVKVEQGPKEWLVRRTFADFQKFNSICKKIPMEGRPALPPVTVSYKDDRKLIDKERQTVQAYLRDVVGHKVLSCHPDFQDFLRHTEGDQEYEERISRRSSSVDPELPTSLNSTSSQEGGPLGCASMPDALATGSHVQDLDKRLKQDGIQWTKQGKGSTNDTATTCSDQGVASRMLVEQEQTLESSSPGRDMPQTRSQNGHPPNGCLPSDAGASCNGGHANSQGDVLKYEWGSPMTEPAAAAHSCPVGGVGTLTRVTHSDDSTSEGVMRASMREAGDGSVCGNSYLISIPDRRPSVSGSVDSAQGHSMPHHNPIQGLACPVGVSNRPHAPWNSQLNGHALSERSASLRSYSDYSLSFQDHMAPPQLRSGSVSSCFTVDDRRYFESRISEKDQQIGVLTYRIDQLEREFRQLSTNYEIAIAENHKLRQLLAGTRDRS